ncbi:EF-hand calcium-binding domain-containing protein 4A [Anabrus simplex]|uniref:EF-hand calcium-binding domain-containing protein 4A n=1 Tax=Anabrus simplex TaxID=316456 RepID=UPI0035A33CA4
MKCCSSMETSPSSLSTRIMDSILSERAQQLFLLSDQERKGFIVKRDMQRMRSEIPLSPEQLEAVFDSLDVKGNGYLTIEQFLEGFGQFLNSHSASNGTKVKPRVRNGTTEHIYCADVDDPELTQEQADADHLEYLLQQLHSTNMLHNVEILRQLCRRVQRDSSSQIQSNLEMFLQQLIQDLKTRQHEQWELEESMRVREEEHNKQVQKLFEEMETQLAEDKDLFRRQEDERLRISKKELEEELSQKEEFIRDILAERQKMSDQLREFRTRESNAREEQLQLLRGKEDVEMKLDQQYHEVYSLQQQLHEIQKNEELKRQSHISAGFCLARRIMLEQQGLLQQLQLLRQMANTITAQDSFDNDVSESNNKSRKPDENNTTQYPSIETTSGFLDDYEYDEDFSHPVFQRSELLKSSLELQTSPSSYGTKFHSNIPSLHDELASTQKMIN